MIFRELPRAGGKPVAKSQPADGVGGGGRVFSLSLVRSISASRDRAARQLERLPEPLRKLDQARQTFKVKISSGLQSLALAVDEPEPLRGLNF
jgi:hypothetical protein